MMAALAPTDRYQVMQAILTKSEAPVVKVFVATMSPGGAPPIADLAYREVQLDRVDARRYLVQTYQEMGSISAAAHR